MILIDKENIELYLMMLADGELQDHEEQAVLDYIAKHPEYEEVLLSFQEVKIPTEKMMFPNLELLLKKETTTLATEVKEKQGEKVYTFFNWKSIASLAAVSTLGIIGWNVWQPKESTSVLETSIVKEAPIANKAMVKETTNPVSEALPRMSENVVKAKEVYVKTKRKNTLFASNDPQVIKKTDVIITVPSVDLPKVEGPIVVTQPKVDLPSNENRIIVSNNPIAAPEHKSLASNSKLDNYPLAKEANNTLKERIAAVQEVVAEVKHTSIQFNLGNKIFKIR